MLADFIVFLAAATPALSPTLPHSWLDLFWHPTLDLLRGARDFGQHRYGFGRVNATHVRTDIKRSGAALNTRTSCSAPVGSTN
ncbi:hypothetical protein BDZ89DRAFT_1059495 [Hymenopellis radicata]|nr:hypothetical protein BDZ89DRAFT_1059495 [Hymenopellis radicata]